MCCLLVSLPPKGVLVRDDLASTYTEWDIPGGNALYMLTVLLFDFLHLLLFRQTWPSFYLFVLLIKVQRKVQELEKKVRK